MTSEDFAKRMVEMINQKKKFYAEQKAKARRSKPMTQAQQRDYMNKVFSWSKNFQRNKRPLKQKARKGIHIDKTAQDETEEEREAFMKDKVTDASSESEIEIDAIPTA
ncbi:hypothetical protein Tco_1450519, partial [Tanacetum coccineum]